MGSTVLTLALVAVVVFHIVDSAVVSTGKAKKDEKSNEDVQQLLKLLNAKTSKTQKEATKTKNLKGYVKKLETALHEKNSNHRLAGNSDGVKSLIAKVKAAGLTSLLNKKSNRDGETCSSGKITDLETFGIIVYPTNNGGDFDQHDGGDDHHEGETDDQHEGEGDDHHEGEGETDDHHEGEGETDDHHEGEGETDDHHEGEGEGGDHPADTDVNTNDVRKYKLDTRTSKKKTSKSLSSSISSKSDKKTKKHVYTSKKVDVAGSHGTKEVTAKRNKRSSVSDRKHISIGAPLKKKSGEKGASCSYGISVPGSKIHLVVATAGYSDCSSGKLKIHQGHDGSGEPFVSLCGDVEPKVFTVDTANVFVEYDDGPYPGGFLVLWVADN